MYIQYFRTQLEMYFSELKYSRSLSFQNMRTYTEQIYKRVYKNHFKMVKGCRIDIGLCKKALSRNDSPKTLGTRVSCKTGTGLGGQRARQV